MSDLARSGSSRDRDTVSHMAMYQRIGGALAAALMFTAATMATSPTAALTTEARAYATAKPVVYLTFDDGPSTDGETARLLDILDRYDARATFFVLGNKLDSAASHDVLRRMIGDGHAVANHSWDHPKFTNLEDPSKTLSDEALVEGQLRRTHDRVKAVANYEMQCFRAPWGKSQLTKAQVLLIEDFGYQVENDWSDNDASEYVFEGQIPTFPAEWSTARKASERIRLMAPLIAAELATAEDGDTFLMHDGVEGRTALVNGVEQFLAEHGADYRFEVIPGCGVAGSSPPTPAGPTYSGPIADAASIADVLAASDYRPADADFLRLYHALLARSPDLPGAKYWLSLARQGSSLDDVAWSFSQSNEFTQRYGSLDNASFVSTVYSNVLGRSPDAEGYAYWLGKVQSGSLSRHGVVRWIAENDEFRNAHPYSAT